MFSRRTPDGPTSCRPAPCTPARCRPAPHRPAPRRSFLLVLITVLALVLTPGLADARAGAGSSFGSRGSQTWSAPPATNTAPYASSMQRSLTPGSSSYGSGYGGGYRGGFGSGLLGGLLGFGLAGLLLGHGLMGFGMFGLFGLLIRIAIIVFIVRWVMRMVRGPSPMYAGGPAMFAPGGGMAGPMGGPGPMAGGARSGLLPISIAPADYQAFEQLLVAVQAAWSAHDLNQLSALLTPEMLSYFGEQLAGQTSRGVRNTVTDVHLVQGDLAQAWSEGGRDYATVAMRFQMIDTTYDQAGRVVDGSPTEHVTATEVWTFVRVSGGRWILSAIQQAR
jgi:predicted lipid-binding transport protein (Tim44 family)